MPHKSGLGKGLGALIPGEDEQLHGEGILQIATDQIVVNPRQPRSQIEAGGIEELSASIREYGILQPLVVCPEAGSGRYILIAGERRWRAAQQAGLSMVPAIARQASEQQQLEIALVENLQRSDLKPLETAQAYRQLAEEFDLSQEEIAARVGKSRTSVTNTLRLLKLAEPVQQALTNELITEGHARALLALPTPQAQASALQVVVSKELNVRQTEELVRKLTGQRPPRRPKAETPPEIQALEERLRTRLGTRVHLHHGPKGGSLSIYYYSDEELNALIAQILNESS
ncbi:MAG: ParB/RepB/Spo0J family partition protein [Chloroflexi bacterium]|nr:ParB/RepB/Spo0J family partition protein [Chloroflexota bacterium]